MFNKSNIIFALICIGVLTVLLMAPPKQGSYYPADEAHLNVAKISTKRNMHEECGKCHFEGGVRPIPETHKKRTRCYGCHTSKPAESAEKK